MSEEQKRKAGRKSFVALDVKVGLSDAQAKFVLRMTKKTPGLSAAQLLRIALDEYRAAR